MGFWVVDHQNPKNSPKSPKIRFYKMVKIRLKNVKEQVQSGVMTVREGVRDTVKLGVKTVMTVRDEVMGLAGGVGRGIKAVILHEDRHVKDHAPNSVGIRMFIITTTTPKQRHKNYHNNNNNITTTTTTTITTKQQQQQQQKQQQ